MSEFSVNTTKINSLADLLEHQANELQKAGDSVENIGNNLSIQGSTKTSVMAAMKTMSSDIKERSSLAFRMGTALREIASQYRSAENRILGITGPESGKGTAGQGGHGSGSKGEGGRNGKDKSSAVFSKDPVNLNTGNFILDNQDMEIPGFHPLILGRFYNSMGTFSGILGKDWNMSFEVRLFLNMDPMHPDSVAVMREDGWEENFRAVDDQKYIPIDNVSELVRNERGFVYRTMNGDCYLFDSEGKYQRYENAHHIGFDLIYRDGQLERVQKDSGEFFKFDYDEAGHLVSTKDHTDRTCQYEFDGDYLKRVILPDGNAYEYTYNKAGRISRVVNPRRVEAVETEYDERGRAVYQKFADGSTNYFEYNDAERAVIMTERNGKKSIHYHDEQYRNICNVYPDGKERFEYNERNQKVLMEDRLGNVTHLRYDNRGNITEIRMADKTKIAMTYNRQNSLLTLSVNGKNKLRNQYNTFGDVISVEDGLGRKTEYIYDEYGRVIGIHMPGGGTIDATYDSHSNLTAVREANGAVTGFSYDALNRLIQQVNALGQKDSYDYDLMGRVICETRADGHSKYYQYDAWGNVVAVRDFDGSESRIAYNENNKLAAWTDAAGRKICFEYDSMWNISKVILPNNSVLQYVYDENNRLAEAYDAEGNRTLYTHDAMGNMLSQTDAEGAAVNYTWDSNGRCIRKTAADGTATEYGYDEDDHIIYMKDAEGVELFRTFDAAGQLIAEKDSLGSIRNYTYGENGDLLSVLDENGKGISFRYADGLHKISEVLYADGTKKQYTYDLVGNCESYTDTYGTVLRYQYDELNRLIKVIKKEGCAKEYGYDLLGRVISEKDYDGNITKYQYSVTGQLLTVEDALGHVTKYSYDAMDELVAVLREAQDTGQQSRQTYERNLKGQITRIIDALGETETYHYDSAGRIIEKTDREGLQTKYTYNKAGLLESVKWADGRETVYGYSPLRRLNRIDDWTGKTELSYDKAGHLTQIIYPDERSLDIKYDMYGNRTDIRYPDGREIAYTYDERNRLEKIEQDGSFVSFAYDRTGNISSKSMSDGLKIQYEYNRDGSLARMTHTDSEGILDEFTFAYDALGRRKQYGVYRKDDVSENGSYEYSYDSTGRLLQVMKDQRTIRAYSYDAFGNRSSMMDFHAQTGKQKKTKYEYDLRGGLLRMISDDLTEEFRYDRRGNLTEQIKNGSLYCKYQYDALNRLARTQRVDGDEAAYQYNGLGYRVGMQSTQNGKESRTSYVLDYSRIYNNLMEKEEDGQKEDYIWGLGLEGFAADASRGWYLTDTQGSVLRKTDGHRTLYMGNYDEFGNPSVKDTNGEEFGYSGFLYDRVAGTYYAQARQYRACTGSFDAMDRIGGDITASDTINPYIYCVHDPINHSDKSGYWFGVDDLIAAGVGAVGNMAGVFVGDVIDSVTAGKWNFSSIQDYAGAAIGGAAGGVTTLYAGPIAGGAVAGGVTTLTTEGLKWATDPQGYDKSVGDVLKDTVVDAGKGALSGAVSKLIGKGTEKLAESKLGKWVVSKTKGHGKIGQKIADFISDKASGKSSKQWTQLTKLLKNQHDVIAKSPALKKKLYSLLLSGCPTYLLQEILGKIKPTKVAWKWGKKSITEWLKECLGLNESEEACAASG